MLYVLYMCDWVYLSVLLLRAWTFFYYMNDKMNIKIYSIFNCVEKAASSSKSNHKNKFPSTLYSNLSTISTGTHERMHTIKFNKTRSHKYTRNKQNNNNNNKLWAQNVHCESHLYSHAYYSVCIHCSPTIGKSETPEDRELASERENAIWKSICWNVYAKFFSQIKSFLIVIYYIYENDAISFRLRYSFNVYQNVCRAWSVAWLIDWMSFVYFWHMLLSHFISRISTIYARRYSAVSSSTTGAGSRATSIVVLVLTYTNIL